MPMKTIKVAEATNTQLDWLVAKCWYSDRRVETGVMGHAPFAVERQPGSGDLYAGWMLFTPTTSPDLMWPIIDRERIATTPFTVSVGPDAGTKEWFANTERNSCYSDGSTSLIAAARCYVVSKLGETVEVPEELT